MRDSDGTSTTEGEKEGDRSAPSLRVKSLIALKWASIGELLTRAVSPLSLLVLARFLTPGEYGVFFAAVLVVSFCQTVIESGVVRSLIQKRGDIQHVASSAFALVCGVSLALACVLWLAAPFLNRFLTSDPDGALVISILALQLPLIAAGAVHRALLERELRFQPIVLARLSAVLMTVAVSLPMAISGFGVWALVTGALLGSACDAVVLWVTSGFRPKPRLSRADLESVASFSAWTLGQDILAWLVIYADSIMVAVLLSSEQLGTYRIGTVLVVGIFAAIFAPAERVLFSYFSKFPDKDSVKYRLCALILIGILAAPPLGLLLVALAADSHLIFPVSWSGVGFVIAIVAMREALANVVFAVDPAYKGIGRPDVIFKVRLVNLTLLITLQWLALYHSFDAFLLTRLAVTAVAMGIILFVVRRFFGPCEARWDRGQSVAIAWFLAAAVLVSLGQILAWDIARYAGLVVLCVPFAVSAFHVLRRVAEQRL